MRNFEITILLATICGLVLNHWMPFPDDRILVVLTRGVHPKLYASLKWAWVVMLYTTPALLLAAVGSQVYIFSGWRRGKGLAVLPPFPKQKDSDPLRIVLGEAQHPRELQPGENPHWITIPIKALYTGMLATGATGAGKTAAAIYPTVNQILSWNARNDRLKTGAIVLEVKGDLCFEVERILKAAGREQDYIELSMDGTYRYNPLQNDLGAFEAAYAIATLMNQLYGKGKDPFWQQAYTNLVKFVILLHRVVDGYCTLYDVYWCVINRSALLAKVAQGDAIFAAAAQVPAIETYIAVERSVWESHRPEINSAEWTEVHGEMRTLRSTELLTVLDHQRIAYRFVVDDDAELPPDNIDPIRLAQFEAVKRWLQFDWMEIEDKLRTSIVEGISVCLSLFDSSPDLKRVFCPPKETYDPVLNKDGRFGRPLPSLREMIESGKVLALNFPITKEAQTSRIIAVLMKGDYQRTMLNRIVDMARHPDRHFRDSLFLADEYQMLATVGQGDPSGDDNFFARSRQSRCIPVVATQSFGSLKEALHGNGWEVLVQCFRTKLFLTVADAMTARAASELAGRHEPLIPSYNISESGQDVRVSALSGKAQAHKAGVTVSKSYQPQMRSMFEPGDLMRLPNYVAMGIIYDGSKTLPPQFVYLKPWFLDKDQSYFLQLESGKL
jgi:hypothetical protein